MMVRRLGWIGSGLLVVTMLAGPASAVPVAVGIGAFTGSETLIDFNGIPNGTLINSQFAGDGITFSGNLWSDTTNAGLIPGSGGTVASNFSGVTTCVGCYGDITIDLAEAALRVGFQAVTNNATDLTVNVFAYSGGNLVFTGDLDFNTGLTSTFVGIEDTDLGIDRLVLSPVGAAGPGRALLIDNVLFESAAAVVPEPSAALLFPVGLLVAARMLRRPRQRVA
jgi:hypothetical protein